MIDTVCLLIPRKDLHIVEAECLGMQRWSLQANTEQYQKYVKNPPKKFAEEGSYFPRLTNYKRKFSMKDDVRIEFSAPKLLFQNNLDELIDKDFSEIISTLQERLRTMGVIVSKSVLENAPTSSVHFSKNIKLEDGYTASHIISEINKIDLRKNFDMARARYINNGESWYAHTTSHQLVIYDKMADLGKSKKRAIDKEQTPYQLSLFEEIKDEEMLEVLRFEVRLSKKQKLKQVLSKFGYTDNPTFKSIFSESLSKKVVIEYWNTLIKERNLHLFSISISPKDILRALLNGESGVKPKQAIYLFGLLTLGKDGDGMRELRSILSKSSSDRSWYRITKDIKKAGENINKNQIRNWVVQIDDSLDSFISFKLKKYENQT